MQDQIVEKRDEIRAAETTMSASLNALAPMQAANDAEYAVFVRDWDTTAKLDERHRAVAPLGNLVPRARPSSMSHWRPEAASPVDSVAGSHLPRCVIR